MPGYNTHIRSIDLGGLAYRIRSLVDIAQFADPDGNAHRVGISSSQWSLFGHVWPCSRMLARAMTCHQVSGRRILEVGCGLGLASLVLRQRGADITASDLHPLAEVFLAYNAALNALPAVAYRTLDWESPSANLGRFDLIIGSDVLYERDHARQLSALLPLLAAPDSEVVIADPGRGNSAHFTRELLAQGYLASEERAAMASDELPPFRGRLLYYRRGGVTRAASA